MTAAPPAGLVVVAHGSRSEAANAAHRTVTEDLAARLPGRVTAAFLELADPSIPDAIDALVAAGDRRIVVLPFLLYPGRHVAEDIPALVAAAGRRHPGVTVELTAAFGADPAVVDVLAAQAARALAGDRPG